MVFIPPLSILVTRKSSSFIPTVTRAPFATFWRRTRSAASITSAWRYVIWIAFADSSGSRFTFSRMFQVDDVVAAVKDLTSKKIRTLDPEPKIGAHGKPVVFLHPKDCGGVLVELEQR